MHNGGVDFDARKRRNVDLICFNTAVKIRVVKYVYTMELSDLTFTSFTPRNLLQTTRCQQRDLLDEKNSNILIFYK